MSQENGKPKIEATPSHSIIINQPMERDYATGGGPGPEDTLIEGDEGIVTPKWQGYPPVNLNVVGKPFAPLPEIAIPRYTGTALYATRVMLPDMLYVKMIQSPHPRERASCAVLTFHRRNGCRECGTSSPPGTPQAPHPFPVELNHVGETVAFVAADTEDLAEDAAAVIEVDYEVLPAASTLEQVMASDAPLINPAGNLRHLRPDQDGI